MAEVLQDPLEVVLRLCASAAPKPWFPRLDTRLLEADRHAVGNVLELLWLEKLVERSPEESPESGPGLLLTPLGAHVLQDPDALRRLREGKPVADDEPGSVVRASFRSRGRPIVTRVLLFANIAVFLYGFYLCRANPKLTQAYLTGFVTERVVERAFLDIEHRLGAVLAEDIIQGEWWRLLSCCFVHGGLLHLGMNMYVLYVLGSFVEQTWGRLRYLVIYLVAGWGGSCVAMAYAPGKLIQVGEQLQLRPSLLMGASGAVCGIFAAVVIWVLLNGKHLPQAVARRARGRMVFNVVLIVVISVLPGVSGYAHLGGAVFGAAAALLLQVNRFGRTPLRWLVLLGLVPLPLIGVSLVRHQRATNPAWHMAEDRVFEKTFLPRIQKVTRAADESYRTAADPLVNMAASRRNADAVAHAVAELNAQCRALLALVQDLDGAGPYASQEAEEARKVGREYVEAEQDLLALAVRCLEAGDRWTRQDTRALEKQEALRDQLSKKWRELLTR